MGLECRFLHFTVLSAEVFTCTKMRCAQSSMSRYMKAGRIYR